MKSRKPSFLFSCIMETTISPFMANAGSNGHIYSKHKKDNEADK
jgi:hypothetical protein